MTSQEQFDRLDARFNALYLDFDAKRVKTSIGVITEKVFQPGRNGGQSYKVWTGNGFRKRPNGKDELVPLNEHMKMARECRALVGMLFGYDYQDDFDDDMF